MEKTDAAPAAGAASAPQKKPRIALFVATAGGLGYLPKAPGTWGSLLGVALASITFWMANINFRLVPPTANGSWAERSPLADFLANQAQIALFISIVGVWASSRAAQYWKTKDPQRVVVDEVSGQSIAYLGLFSTGPFAHGWIYLLAGFILFRVFDIWKPFPARQAESLPGGWGIMADDWVAGVYAAVVLYLLQRAGL
jgi:phosphatidylglycerophosphatase A